MNKRELKSMIREVVEEEVYRVLPGLLKEAVTKTITELAPPKRRPVKQAQRQKPPQNGARKMSKKSILEEIGYSEYGLADEEMETYNFDSSNVNDIAEYAGVPVKMTGGLRSHENNAGQGGYSDMDGGLPAVETETTDSPIGEVPDFLAAAIKNAKNVVDRADEMGGTFRPGKR